MEAKKMKTVLFDLDGTMYRGPQPIEAGIRAVDFCFEHGIPYLFLTNNSMRTPYENVKHMENMGYHHVKPEHFVNSAMAAAGYAANLDPNKRKAWYIGMNGMKEALLNEGFEITEDQPDYVFVGLDKTADYAKYSKALAFLLNGARLIGTNHDRILAKPGGFEVGNGSVVALFEYATATPSPRIGKPDRPILDYALKKAGISKEDAVLVGDNLETDVALGYNNKVQTVFVQSGVHHEKDIQRLKIFPDLCVESLDDVDFLRLCEG
ncbi:HAD-IIA family hydrolase [Allobaculum sp. JKK-2023]|uniref:HAD-IIA family hydrolase n=1 Tax=Allobaculum sp. JKK-2023 TaxID=3108943 RepID=UPI002B060591|nr:HAD-IIA family hydrolase [Allobaculum sp. JKK-2023]